MSHALRLFAERGYHHTQIADIIEAAGIARGTFYLYFDSKRAIFAELLDGLFATFENTIRPIDTTAGAPPVGEQTRANVVRVIDTMVSNRDLVRILMRAAVGLDPEFDGKVADFYRKILSVIRGSIEAGIQMGLVRPRDAAVAAMIVLGGLKEIAYHYLVAGDQPPSSEVVAAEFLAVVASGLLREGQSDQLRLLAGGAAS
ncbi:MAG: TetR/AcrR family transcriptional regulator [Deltaproteobacteria bacterium]|nr:TetR/AcrR family transcriptional regulator [Deltaproteobacteria bacterium]